MPDLNTLPPWIWALGAMASYGLLIWVEPTREAFGAGLRWIRRLPWLPIVAGFACASNVIWIRFVHDVPPPAPDVEGLADYSAAAPMAFAGIAAGINRTLFCVVCPAPASFLLLLLFALNIASLFREFRHGLETLVKPGAGVVILCALACSAVCHVCWLAGLGQGWQRFLLTTAGGFFEGLAAMSYQAALVLVTAITLAAPKRKRKWKDWFATAARRLPRLWPFVLGYGVTVPVVRAHFPPDSFVYLVLLSFLALVAILLAFLQVELLGEKRFSGTRAAVSRMLGHMKRRGHWILWFTLMLAIHWFAFHLVSLWLQSAPPPMSVWAVLLGALFAFLEAVLAVWFLASGAFLYQERIVA